MTSTGLSPSVASFLGDIERGVLQEEEFYRYHFATIDFALRGEVWSGADARALANWVEEKPETEEATFHRGFLSMEAVEVFCDMLQRRPKLRHLELLDCTQWSNSDLDPDIFLQRFFEAAPPEAPLQSLLVARSFDLSLSALPEGLRRNLTRLELGINPESFDIPIESIADYDELLQVLAECARLRFLIINTSSPALIQAAVSPRLSSLKDLKINVFEPQAPHVNAAFFEKVVTLVQELLAESRSLMTLELSCPHGRRCEPICVSTLLARSSNSSLKELTLANWILVKDASPLGEERNASIERLKIRHCITTAGSSCFFRQFTGLKSVDLISGSELSGFHVAGDWIQLFQNNHGLEKLEFGCEGFNDDMVGALGSATCTKHPSLKSLCLSYKGNQDAMGRPVGIEGFVAQYALSDLTLNCCWPPLSASSRQAIADGLRLNNVLESLTLYDCDYDPCFEALQQNPSLKRLSIAFPYPGMTNATALVRLLGSNPILESLELSSNLNSDSCDELFQFHWPYLKSCVVLGEKRRLVAEDLANLPNAKKLRYLLLYCKIEDQATARTVLAAVKKQGVIGTWEGLSFPSDTERLEPQVRYHLKLNRAGRALFEMRDPTMALWPLLLGRLTADDDGSVLYALVKTVLTRFEARQGVTLVRNDSLEGLTV